ncbi:phage portal protein [Lichenihabitans psoromatis]|uniref:phage portal protein n=1 Tax=Lichenihabitans psoromatis TaxID=2528642 RepID=UPI00103837BA|nr:phage portal protein [Lichenihabitans psoromatis]
MTILSLLNPLGWFGSYRAKLSGGQVAGQQSSGGGADDSYSGKAVTAETALTHSTYWACVKLLGQTIGTLPLNLYLQATDGSLTPAVDHPLYDLLHYQPNANLTAVEFWEGVGSCIAVWGNAYVLKQYIGPRLVALDLLRPFWMSVFRGQYGQPVYRYTDPLLGQRDYTAAEMFHVKGFGFGDFVGLSALQFNRQSIGTALAVDEAAGSVFRNSMRMSGWFRFKGGNGVLTKEQTHAAKQRLIDPYSGSGNAGVPGILPGDFEWIPTSMNPVDAQMLDNRRLNVEEICRGFGVPPMMIGHAAAGQTMWGTGVEQIMLGFLTTGLRPYLHRIEAAIARDIIGRADRRVLVAKFDVDELLRGDSKGMAETASQLANAGVKTRNEIRRSYSLPPKPGGDTLTVQSALLPIEMLGLVAKLPKDKPVEAGADTMPNPEDKGL